jgi:ankyrin repeat protein
LSAVRRGDVEEVARLLDAKPHLVEARNHRTYDQTPLIMAVVRGHVDLVRLLLERGADVNDVGGYGRTALHRAAEEGHEEVVSILLDCGADPSKKDIYGCTPLMAASCNGHLGVARRLLQVPECGLDERDDGGSTALWWACHYGHVEVARTLLLAGADHILASYGQTPRQAAKEYGHPECVALLEVSGSVYLSSQASPLTPRSLFLWQGWEGELERGYVVHRARCLAEQHSLLQPALDAAAAFLASRLASSLGSVSIPAFLSPRTRVVPVPHVEVVRLSEDEETGASTGQGKRKVEEEGGGDVQGPSEAERDATVKYVMQDLHPELYIELMAGFNPIKGPHEEADDASSSDSSSDGEDE